MSESLVSPATTAAPLGAGDSPPSLTIPYTQAGPALDDARPSVRYSRMAVQIDGRPINFAAYPYLVDLYDLPLTKDPLDVVVIKGAQLGFTSWQILKVIDGAIHTYQNQIGIFFPTEDDVAKFSRTRFSRLLIQNPELASHIKETNSAFVRQIGRVFISFNGMRSRSAAKSTPMDLIVYDERDEMNDAMVELADRRLDGSEFKHRIEISTPTIPDYGVHYTFESSTKHHWTLRCDGCRHKQVLELEFPKCLVRQPDGTAIRACVKCGHTLHPGSGRWVALYPSRDRIGYYVSQLNSPTVDPTEILDEYEAKQRDGRDLTEFYNSRLGLPYAAIDDALDAPMVLRLCKGYPRALRHPGPTAMGVDVGKVTHWMVGEKITETHGRILSWGTVPTVDDIGPEVIDRYGVRSFVIDQMAESHKVRAFCTSYPNGYGSYYSSQMRDRQDWNHKERTVTCNRTETLDASHAAIVHGRVEFPRADRDLTENLIPQLCNLARVIRKNENTQRMEPRWVNRGTKRDHWRHAWNYLWMAMDRISPSIYRNRSKLEASPSFVRNRTWMGA